MPLSLGTSMMHSTSSSRRQIQITKGINYKTYDLYQSIINQYGAYFFGYADTDLSDISIYFLLRSYWIILMIVI